jgi:hypothetical protein
MPLELTRHQVTRDDATCLAIDHDNIQHFVPVVHLYISQ